jgi:hypothetical protein
MTMELFLHIYSLMDNLFMPVFRLPDSPLSGYYLGTFVLSALCFILGKYSVFCAFRFNRDKIIHNSNEMTRYQDISIKALRAGNKYAFRACNSMSNDAYAKIFFSQIALSAATLWPAFLALGWMQYRFGGVDFRTVVPMPGANYIFGYVTTFALCYVIVRILSEKTLPVVAVIKKLL